MPQTDPKREQPRSLPPWVESGFINDESGKATEAERERLRTDEPFTDPTERGLYRVYRQLSMAGFDPLSPQEIAQMLGTLEPGEALPGVTRPAPDRQQEERRAIAAMDQVLNPKQQMTGPANARDTMLRSNAPTGSPLGGPMRPGGATAMNPVDKNQSALRAMRSRVVGQGRSY